MGNFLISLSLLVLGLTYFGCGQSRGGQVCVRLSYKYLLVLSSEVLLVLKSQVSLSLCTNFVQARLMINVYNNCDMCEQH